MARSARWFTACIWAADWNQPKGLKGEGCTRDWAAKRTLSQTLKVLKMLVFW